MPRYAAYELPSRLSPEQVAQLREILGDEFGAAVKFEEHHLEVPSGQNRESPEGFGFNWQDYLPFLQLAIISISIAREARVHEPVIDRIQDTLGIERVDPIEIPTDEMKNDPGTWIGEDLWEWLPEVTRNEIERGFEALDCRLESATVLYMTNALDHCLSELEGVDDGLGSHLLGELDAEAPERILPPDVPLDLVNNIDYVNRQRVHVTSPDALGLDDAIGTVVIVRKTLQMLAEEFG